MTKDRRLGRGLAALLGTPIDEQLESGSANATPSSASRTPGAPPSLSASTTPGTFSEPAPRSETIQKLAREARDRAADSRNSISPLSIPMEPARPTAAAAPVSTSEPHEGLREIPVHLIDSNPFQPRRQFNAAEIESLAESIKEHQQLQPILVRQVGERYQLISGERRLRATIHAQRPTIRAEIRVADDRLVAELAIIENLQRKDLNAIEKAMSFKRYISEHRCTQDELAQRLKIDRSTVTNMMRLLELPETITDAVLNEQITAGHAKALLSLGSIKEQCSFLEQIVDEGWSVRETESRVAEAVADASNTEGGLAAPVRRRKSSKPDQIQSLESELKMNLGTRVDINQTSRGRGKITIHFTSIEEFERLRKLLAQEKAAGKRAA